jgi:peptidylprolyl isomerase
MAEAKTGDRVRVHYTGSLQDGTVFDSSVDGDPLEFKLGDGNVIPGFENAVTGMSEGATKKVELPPDEAYGPRIDDLVIAIPKSNLPPDLDPEVGMVLEARSDEGMVTHVTIVGVADDTVTLDGNHELAGQTLIFEITMVQVVSA